MNATARVVPVVPGVSSPTAAPPDWIETPTAARIIGTLSYAQAIADIAIIYGGVGIGKTSTARRYASTGMNVWLATMTPATSGVVPALEEICAALGIPVANGAAPLHRAIVRKVTATGGLLIIDEAQHLAPAALDQLRGIHDAAGIGLALVGSKEIHARMVGGDSAPALERLRSRVGKRLALTGAAPGDIEAVADAWEIGSPGRKVLAELGAKTGGLRVVVKALRLAAMQASTAGQAISEAHLRAAWRELGGV